MGEKLKSALELAMERFSKQGESSVQLTDAQKAQIAETKNKTAAKLAEMEILHQAELAKLSALPPPESRAAQSKLQENYIQERQRLERERDSKIERIRTQSERS